MPRRQGSAHPRFRENLASRFGQISGLSLPSRVIDPNGADGCSAAKRRVPAAAECEGRGDGAILRTQNRYGQ